MVGIIGLVSALIVVPYKTTIQWIRTVVKYCVYFAQLYSQFHGSIQTHFCSFKLAELAMVVLLSAWVVDANCSVGRNLAACWFRSRLRLCFWICRWEAVTWAFQVFITICLIWLASRRLLNPPLNFQEAVQEVIASVHTVVLSTFFGWNWHVSVGELTVRFVIVVFVRVTGSTKNDSAPFFYVSQSKICPTSTTEHQTLPVLIIVSQRYWIRWTFGAVFRSKWGFYLTYLYR